MNEGRIPAAKKYITRYTFAIDRARRTIHLLSVKIAKNGKSLFWNEQDIEQDIE